MISNERPSPYGHRSHSSIGSKPPLIEETIKSDKIQIERKTFVFTLKENPRGRFLRITEDVNGRRDTIIIPATGLEDFKRLFDDMLKTSVDAPAKNLGE
ncbi:MAG: RNA-binding protein [Verrucomicrobia bacterium]|nr:RNA-binding protein [Verrucomicrobiota bacterium]